MSDGKMIQDLVALSKPATLLVEKVSNALGRHFDPRQVVRMAEAEARANHIRRVAEAETDIEVRDLQLLALDRWIHGETRRYINEGNILMRSLTHLNHDARPEMIENDTITNIFDKCRDVSDEEMQEWWARLFAEEANKPGTFSRATVNIVANMDRSTAKLFQNLCRFQLMTTDDAIPRMLAVYINTYGSHSEHGIYAQYGVTHSNMRILQEIGLVSTALYDGARTAYDVLERVDNLSRVPGNRSPGYCEKSVGKCFAG